MQTNGRGRQGRREPLARVLVLAELTVMRPDEHVRIQQDS